MRCRLPLPSGVPTRLESLHCLASYWNLCRVLPNALSTVTLARPIDLGPHLAHQLRSGVAGTGAQPAQCGCRSRGSAVVAVLVSDTDDLVSVDGDAASAVTRAERRDGGGITVALAAIIRVDDSGDMIGGDARKGWRVKRSC